MTRPQFPTGIVLPVQAIQRIREEQEAYDRDPEAYERPWKVSIPLVRDPEYKIYEYACQEGNKAVENVLRGGRKQEQ